MTNIEVSALLDLRRQLEDGSITNAQEALDVIDKIIYNLRIVANRLNSNIQSQ